MPRMTEERCRPERIGARVPTVQSRPPTSSASRTMVELWQGSTAKKGWKFLHSCNLAPVLDVSLA